MNFSGFELSSIVAVVLLLLQLSSAAVLPADYAAQYGVVAADEMSLPEDGSLFAERPSKRAQTFVRFGKRAQTFVRFGKRGQTFVRFGRSAPLDQ